MSTTSSWLERISQKSTRSRNNFHDIKDLGKLSYFLGVLVIPVKREAWIGQPAYTEKPLTKTGMHDCKPVKTPSDPGSHLEKPADNEVALEQQQYQSVVGSLLYLTTCTRPNIAYAVGTLARFTSKPNKTHWTAAKRVL